MYAPINIFFDNILICDKYYQYNIIIILIEAIILLYGRLVIKLYKFIRTYNTPII